jgi:hypothetical protein
MLAGYWQVSIGDEVLLKFSGVPLGEACSIVLRGATEQIIGNVVMYPTLHSIA